MKRFGSIFFSIIIIVGMQSSLTSGGASAVDVMVSPASFSGLEKKFVSGIRSSIKKNWRSDKAILGIGKSVCQVYKTSGYTTINQRIVYISLRSLLTLKETKAFDTAAKKYLCPPKKSPNVNEPTPPPTTAPTTPPTPPPTPTPVETFSVPAGWQVVNYEWANPADVYLQTRVSGGESLSLSNAPSMRGSLTGTICSGEFYESAFIEIEFLDANGNLVSRNAVTNGKPDLSKPDPTSAFGASRELFGYSASSSDYDANGCESDSVDLAGWARASQIRVNDVLGSGSGLMGMTVRGVRA